MKISLSEALKVLSDSSKAIRPVSRPNTIWRLTNMRDTGRPALVCEGRGLPLKMIVTGTLLAEELLKGDMWEVINYPTEEK